MDCQRCHSGNPPSAKFCMECGHALTRAVPVRAGPHRDPKAYTPKFLIDKILTTRHSVEGEWKIVTVLFADVAGYTSIAEKLDPEEVHRVMDECFWILMDAIHRYEGTVNQFTGDGVMALFGAPVTHEDHAQRACLAALDIQEALAEYRERLRRALSINFRMRLGLNSGPLIVGSIGDDLRMDYSAIGDTTHLASRMERMARPGSILLSENTYRIVSQSFQCRPLGRLTVKGRTEPVEAFRLEAKREVPGPVIGLQRRVSPEMVGRDRELDRLEFQVTKAVNGEGSVVNIVGEAGIGKSRLVAELRKAEVMQSVTLLEARGVSMGRTLSFHPLIRLMKNQARIREEDTETAAFEKLCATIGRICGEETDEVLPFVATMMGMRLPARHAERVAGIDGEALEKMILKSLRMLLEKLSGAAPVVIVTDDLHWADTTSLSLIESLFRLAETRRILFINVLRPGHLETGDRILVTLRETLPEHSVEIILPPLDEQASEALLSKVMDIRGLHRGLISHIVERAGGNPFFLEEVVRSLIDQGAVIPTHGGYVVTDKISAVTIPSTINDVLMARIDRLEEGARDLVKVASVIGRNFFLRILAEIIGPDRDIEADLSTLKEIEFLRERRRMGEVEYLFKHALAQETAYESILPKKRQELHLRVAAAIEKIFVERIHEFYGMLAYHYSRARHLEKAEAYLIRAGEEALRSSASNEALHYYQDALDLYLSKPGERATPEKTAMLEKNIALALFNKGQYERAVACFDNALRYYWGSLPRYGITRALKSLSALLHFTIALYFPSLKFRKRPTERDKETLSLFYRKCSALAIIDSRRFLIESLHLYRDLTRFDLTSFELGREIFLAASALFSFPALSFRISRKLLDPADGKVHPRNLKTVTLYELLATAHSYFEGNWKVLPGVHMDLVDRDVALGNMYHASQYLLWQGLSSVYQGSLANARSIVDKLADLVEVYDHGFCKLAKYKLYTTLLIEIRSVEDALHEVDLAIRFARKAGFTLSLIDLYASKALLNVFMQEGEAAETSLSQADDIRSKVNAAPIHLSNFYRSHLHFCLYRLQEAIEENDDLGFLQYRQRSREAVRRLTRISRRVPQHRTESYRLAGVHSWLVGKRARAMKCWKRSLQEGERLGARLDLSRTYFEVGRRLLEDRDRKKTLNGIEAEAYLEKARALFVEMGLQKDLDEWSCVRGGSP